MKIFKKDWKPALAGDVTGENTSQRVGIAIADKLKIEPTLFEIVLLFFWVVTLLKAESLSSLLRVAESYQRFLHYNRSILGVN